MDILNGIQSKIHKKYLNRDLLEWTNNIGPKMNSHYPSDAVR
jgi:hypothetical protein